MLTIRCVISETNQPVIAQCCHLIEAILWISTRKIRDGDTSVGELFLRMTLFCKEKFSGNLKTTRFSISMIVPFSKKQ